MKSGFLFLVFVWLAADIAAQKKELPVRVLEATERSWVSGAPGGRTGTNYSIKVYINTNRPVEFMFLWIGKENVPVNMEFLNLEIQKKIALGDSLLLTSNKVNGEPYPGFEPRRLPIDYKGAALIQCKVDGKARYFVVKSFTKLPTLSGQ